MTGSSQPPPNVPSSESSDDDEFSSTETDGGIASIKSPHSKRTPSINRKQCSETPKEITHQLNDFGADFLALEPESDHDSNSTEVK